MKWRFTTLGPLVLALCVFALPLHAQTAAAASGSAVQPMYDVTKEVTLTGTVISVVTKNTREMNLPGAGAHLLVETNSGKIDASLGQFAMTGKEALSLKPGQQVQLTGVVKTIGSREVFVTRLVQANGHLYIVRNERGYAVRQSSKGTSEFGSKGGQL